MNTFYLHITGKVQGVWYRASAKDKALELGLKGQIWNQSDGSVGALIQGAASAVAAFVEWCNEGPPLASVEEVTVREEHSPSAFSSFEITKGRV